MSDKPTVKLCRRCGDSSASFCEDWDCHLGWGEGAVEQSDQDELERDENGAP